MKKWKMSPINYETNVLKFYYRIKNWEYKYQFYLDLDKNDLTEVNEKLHQFLIQVDHKNYRLYKEPLNNYAIVPSYGCVYYFGTDNADLAVLFKITWC